MRVALSAATALIVLGVLAWTALVLVRQGLRGRGGGAVPGVPRHELLCLAIPAVLLAVMAAARLTALSTGALAFDR